MDNANREVLILDAARSLVETVNVTIEALQNEGAKTTANDVAQALALVLRSVAMRLDSK